MQINKKLQGAICASVLAVASPAFAASIIPGATAANFDNDTGTSVNTISGFTVAAGSNRKLVVTIGYETASTLSTLTWNGGSQSFMLAVDPGNLRQTQIWYLDNPVATTGDIVATFSANARSLMGVVSLTNAATGGPVVSNSIGSSSATIGLTTTQADTFVVGGFTIQNGQGIPTNPAGFTDIYDGAGNASGSSNSIAGFMNEAVAGAKSYTFGAGTATGGDIGGIAVAGFVAVPEPSVGLLGLAGAVLLLRRRRQ